VTRAEPVDPTVPSRAASELHHVAIRTLDLENTVAVYTEALCCTVAIAWGEAPNRAVLLDTGGGTYIEIFEVARDGCGSDREMVTTRGPILHICFRVDDVDEAHARVTRLGLRALDAPRNLVLDTTTGQGSVAVRLFFFEGPTGELIEMVQGLLP
jgi:catechol 2,3-dioxygenase-like lactoylglutathione lyase family enzyme